MRRFALMLVLAVKHLAAAVRPRRTGVMPGLEELLDRARVPRSAPPELLEFARLADLRMEDEEDDDDGEEDDEDDEDDDSEEDDDADGDDEDAEGDDSEEEDEDDEDDGEEVDESTLDPKVKAILRKERKARREAEKKAKKAERGARRRQRGRREGGKKKSGKRERRDRDDEERDDGPDEGTAKLQRANLISALQEAGYTGKRAKTVARLLDDVEYDDDDEPVDLKDRIEEAEEAYGKEAVRKSSRSKPGGTDGGGGGGDGERPSLTADELEAAKAMGMSAKEYALYKDPQPKIPAKKDK
jgi:hypothetical protein